MPRTPDSFPGERIEESIQFVSGSDYPLQNGQVTYVSGVGFQFMDEGALKGLATLSSSLTPAQHRNLRHLIHFIDQGPGAGALTGAFKETLPFASPFPTLEIWWTSPAKVEKILQLEVTRSAILPVTESWKLFDGATVVETVTDVITYSGVFETSRTRTIT